MTEPRTLPNRRVTPRHCVEGLIEGSRVPGGEVITVLDLSLGGLSMRLDHALAVGEQCRLRLWSQFCPALTLPARIVYSMLVKDARSTPYHLAGLEFLTDGSTAAAIGRLIETSVQQDDATARITLRTGEGRR